MVLRRLLILFFLCSSAIFAQQQGGGGVAPGTDFGPTINVTNAAYGASSANADNNAAFTAAFAAANAYSITTKVVGPRYGPIVSNTPSAGTSLVIDTEILTGDTVYVIVVGATAIVTWTVTDDGGSTYTILASDSDASAGKILIFSSGVGLAKQSSVVTITASASTNITAGIIALPSVGTQTAGTATGDNSSATISAPYTTVNANAFVLTACEFFTGAGTTTLTGTGSAVLRGNVSAVSGTNIGMGFWGTFQGATGTVTSSGTLSASSHWDCIPIEIDGGGSQTQWQSATPTVYIPAGYYYYSGGMAPTNPVTIKCEPGAWLNYTGSAHAVEVGPTNLTALTVQRGYFIDGCTFTGGSKMTQGVFFNSYTNYVGVRNTSFIDFGNPSSFMIAANGQNWDIEIGPQNRFVVDDGVVRNIFQNNLASLSQNSWTRVHDNMAWCVQGSQVGGAAACTVAQQGIGFVLDGNESRLYHNNMDMWNPHVKIICTNSPPCFGTQVDQNQFENAITGTFAPILFSNVTGILITQNTIDMHSTTNSFIQPVGGADTLIGARINFNTLSFQPATTPIVKLNNVTGQTGNYSYSNECSAAFTAFVPCALIHTAGGNITQWNIDQYPSCTMVSGTCTYTFGLTYGVAPKCTGVWNGSGTFTTGASLKIVTSTTTAIATSSTGTDTAVIQMQCSAGDSQ